MPSKIVLSSASVALAEMASPKVVNAVEAWRVSCGCCMRHDIMLCAIVSLGKIESLAGNGASEPVVNTNLSQLTGMAVSGQHLDSKCHLLRAGLLVVSWDTNTANAQD